MQMHLFELETGQFLRSDLPSYTDPIVYYGENLVDPLQSNYPHLQQGKDSFRIKQKQTHFEWIS